MSRYRTYGQGDDPHAMEGDRAFSRMNSRARKNLLQEGEVAYSYNGRMETDGAWQPRKGLQAVSSTLTTDAESLALPFYTYADTTGNSVSRSGDVVTVGFAGAHGIVDGTLAYVSGITGLTPDPNGNREITVNTATEIQFTVSGLSGTAAGTPVLGAPELNDTIVNGVFGACMFSDPNSESAEYCIVATNSKAVAVKLSDGSEIDIDYPLNELVSANCELIQAFDRVYLLRPGKVPLLWNGELSGSPAFAKVSSGSFTQPTELSGAVTIGTDGVVNVAVAGHGLTDGKKVTVIDKNGTELVVGDEYIVQQLDADNFRFVADINDTGTGNTLVFRTSVSVGGGFTHMPAPPWAVYFQRRLIAPYHYSVDASIDSYTDRGVRDELIASDIFDGDTWDPVFNQFRITAGIADYVVALQPFVEDNLLVLNRNSLHLVRGLSGSLADVTSRELTREVGCLARKSVQLVGNQILFLSDNGLYAVSFADEYNLRGVQVPLSEPIQDVFGTINAEYAENATSLYHDNRYYLAVPTGTSQVNNTVFVYNFLNKGWESIDEVQDANWAILELLAGRAGTYNQPYAVNDLGGLHEMESDSRTDGNDQVAVTINGAGATVAYADAYVTTRQYALNSPERARYTRFSAQLEGQDAGESDGQFTAVLQDPDASVALRTLKQYNRGNNLPAGEDATVRGSIRRRGYGCQMRLTATQGRPKLRGMLVEGHLAGRGNRTIT